MDLDMFAGNAEHVVRVVRGTHLDLRSFAVILTQQGVFALYRDDRAVSIAKIRTRLDYRDITFADVFRRHRIIRNAISTDGFRRDIAEHEERERERSGLELLRLKAICRCVEPFDLERRRRENFAASDVQSERTVIATAAEHALLFEGLDVFCNSSFRRDTEFARDQLVRRFVTVTVDISDDEV